MGTESLSVSVPGPGAAGGREASPRRKKLWEIDDWLHCSVIGTCIRLAELRKIGHKADLALNEPPSDYALHRTFAGLAGEPCPASRLVQKHLERLYKTAVQRFARARTEEELARLWREAVAGGEVAGAYWALVTHPAASIRLLGEVYGEVHMLSHLAGAAQRVELRDQRLKKQRIADLEQRLSEVEAAAKRRLREQEIIIQTLNDRLAKAVQAEHSLAQAQARLAELENGALQRQQQAQLEVLTAAAAAARQRAESAEQAAAQWARFARQAEERQQRLARELAEMAQERAALEGALERLLAPCQVADCPADPQRRCPELNLCGLRILYVGGRSRQCANFRALVERHNGQFVHHDGGLSDGRARLGEILQQADAVLCPLDCVSHDAIQRVKQFCKRNAKRLVLLPSSSLSAFTRGLTEVSA